jgi:hypothetical protein
MGIPPINLYLERKTGLLNDAKAIWARLARLHAYLFLAKHQPPSATDSQPGYLEDLYFTLQYLNGKPQSSETLIDKLRDNYEALVRTFKELMDEVALDGHAWGTKLYYQRDAVTHFGRPRYCELQCTQPTVVYIVP